MNETCACCAEPIAPSQLRVRYTFFRDAAAQRAGVEGRTLLVCVPCSEKPDEMALLRSRTLSEP